MVGLAAFHMQVAEAFYSLDRDRSGRLEESELSAADSDRFGRADRDGDGGLSLNEYVEARFAERWARGTDARGSETGSDADRGVGPGGTGASRSP